MFGFTHEPRQIIKAICDADYTHRTQVARKIVYVDEMKEFYYQAVVEDALQNLRSMPKVAR